MAKAAKGRLTPRIEPEILTEDFEEQLGSGLVCDALVTGAALPPLVSPRGQAVRIARCIWRGVTLSGPRAQRVRFEDARIEDSDLANIDLTGSFIERVEIASTRLTGAAWSEAQLRSVLFEECKMDLAVLRMATMKSCVFERCNLADADFYGTDLSGTILRGCDLSRADLSHAKLTGADIRDCRLDGIRGTPANMEGLIISPDQAALLITLFGVVVRW